MQRHLGRWPNDAEFRAEMRRLANLGYVPHPMASPDLGPSADWPLFNAKESWRTSIPSSLQVCPGDFNRCGGVSVQDLFDFLAAWFAGSPRADFNTSGEISVQDLFDFLAAWFGPCLRTAEPNLP